jgi:hypothetical protein
MVGILGEKDLATEDAGRIPQMGCNYLPGENVWLSYDHGAGWIGVGA